MDSSSFVAAYARFKMTPVEAKALGFCLTATEADRVARNNVDNGDIAWTSFCHALDERLSMYRGATTMYIPRRCNGMSYIINDLKTNNTLKTLSLGESNLEDDGMKFIADALRVNTCLTELDLIGAKFTSLGLKEITDALMANTNSSLCSLTLDNNGGGGGFCETGGKDIADLLKTNTLQYLGLYYIGMNVVDIIDALETNTSLNTIILNYMGVDLHIARSLFGMLRTNTTLKSLSLCGGGDYVDAVFDVEMMKYIGDVLRENTSLETLDLDNYDITDEGLGYLLDVLKSNSTLTNISLEMNSITDEGLKCLADALKKNKRKIQARKITTALISCGLFTGDDIIRRIHSFN